MKTNFYSLIFGFLFLISCGNKEESGDVEIMSVEEKTLQTTQDTLSLRDSLDRSQLESDSLRPDADTILQKADTLVQ